MVLLAVAWPWAMSVQVLIGRNLYGAPLFGGRSAPRASRPVLLSRRGYEFDCA